MRGGFRADSDDCKLYLDLDHFPLSEMMIVTYLLLCHDNVVQMIRSFNNADHPNSTVAHHPDKITENHSRAEAYYVHLKFCRDLLLDPAKRFAYDRIGPDILNWQHKTTISDYIYVGLRNLTAYYVGTASVLVVLSVMGYMQQAAYVSID